MFGTIHFLSLEKDKFQGSLNSFTPLGVFYQLLEKLIGNIKKYGSQNHNKKLTVDDFIPLPILNIDKLNTYIKKTPLRLVKTMYSIECVTQ